MRQVDMSGERVTDRAHSTRPHHTWTDSQSNSHSHSHTHSRPHHRRHHSHSSQNHNTSHSGSGHTQFHTAGTHAHGSRSAQMQYNSQPLDPLEADRLRRISSTEIFYPTQESFQAAREQEKRDKRHARRTSTPFPRGSDATIRRENSHNSMRSHRSTGSHRSHRSHTSHRSDRSHHHSPRDFDGSDGNSDGATVNAYEQPHFGPGGEPIEVIGLGRKEPRHRTLSSQNLRSALRTSTSAVPGRNDNPHGHHHRGGGESINRHKPLPTAPTPAPGPPLSYIAPIVDNPVAPYEPRSGHTRQSSHNPLTAGVGGLRSLFSSFSLDPSSASLPSSSDEQQHSTHSRSSHPRHGEGNHHSYSSRPHHSRQSSSRSILPLAPSRSQSRSRRPRLTPADDLYTYLARAEIPQWVDWPGDHPTRRSSSSLGLLSSELFGGGKGRGFESMPPEWMRRLEDAEMGRNAGRMMMFWEGPSKGWEKRIMDWIEDNVPGNAIDETNRWGAQLFALLAPGYDTLEFHDDAVHQAEDYGLLSWLTGSVLQTVASTLHMLRYSSQHFTFHLIPSPRPPHVSPHAPHALWDGFGTLALVNKSDDMDRAFIVEVRPPSVVDYGVLREFAKDGRAGGGYGNGGWYHVPRQCCVGDAGQANLLQAQVYDSCVQNQVYFFVVTNVKHWVFGRFNHDYTKCTVSPIIERKQRGPSVMQCLVAWVVQAVDKRPRAGDQQPFESPYQPSRDAPPYTSPPRHRHPSQASHFSQADQMPYPQPHHQVYNPHHVHPYPSQSSLSSFHSQTPAPPGAGAYPYPMGRQQSGEYGLMPPGYMEGAAPGAPISPSPAPGHTQWGMQVPGLPGGPGVASRPFSPLPGYNGMGVGVGWYSGGMSWPTMR